MRATRDDRNAIRELWSREARPFLRSARWPIVIAVALAAIVLGWIGFDVSATATGEPATFLDKAYLTLQLFVLQSGVPAPTPWQLDVARYLAPAVAAFATLSAAAALLRDRLVVARARRRSDHVVVCGLGRLGALAAKNLRAAGHQVVAIEVDAHSSAVGESREAGVLVLIGDAADRALLRKARVDRARYLLAVTGDDGVNVEIAADAATLVRGRRGAALTCFVHVADDALAGVLQRASVSRGGGAIRIESFDAAERGAPALLSQRPPFDSVGVTPLGPPHLLVVGLGQMGRTLVVHAARRWRSIPGQRRARLKVTVVDRKADTAVALIRERYPAVATQCDIVPLQMELDSAEFERGAFLASSARVPGVTGVFICLSDDAAGLRAAFRLRDRFGTREVPIVVRTTREGGLASLLGGVGDEDVLDGISVFGLLDLVCRPDVLLGGQNEVLARAIHANYVRGEAAKGRTPMDNPSMVEWDLLPETFRESNRDQAGDIRHKLRAIGCDLVRLLDWECPPFAFTADEVETLARIEHDRWVRERLTGGWSYGPVKDEPTKRTPYIVAYGELSDEVQEYDRYAVRQIPGLLAEVDFGIERLGPPPEGRPRGEWE